MKKIIIASTIFAAMAGFAVAQDMPTKATDGAKTPIQEATERGKVGVFKGEIGWWNCKWFPTAFMTEPTTDKIKIDTIPSGAEVVFEGRVVGTTPIVLDYPRKRAPKVVVKKEGFPPTQIRIRRKLNKTGWTDALVTIIPFTALVTWQDWAYNVGAILEYSEKDIIVELPKNFDDGPLCPEAYNGNVELRSWLR